MELMQGAEHRALICSLVKAMRSEDSWAGETQIQKCVYFLQNLMAVPTGYEFILYKHGPYSFDLQRELAVMRARLQLDIEPRYNYGPSFTLGPRGELDIERVASHNSAIEFVAKKLSTKNVRSLERLSTVFFVQTENSDLDDNQVARRVNKLKPHIPIPTALEAVEEVNELRDMAS